MMNQFQSNSKSGLPGYDLKHAWDPNHQRILLYIDLFHVSSVVTTQLIAVRTCMHAWHNADINIQIYTYTHKLQIIQTIYLSICAACTYIVLSPSGTQMLKSSTNGCSWTHNSHTYILQNNNILKGREVQSLRKPPLVSHKQAGLLSREQTSIPSSLYPSTVYIIHTHRLHL